VIGLLGRGYPYFWLYDIFRLNREVLVVLKAAPFSKRDHCFENLFDICSFWHDACGLKHHLQIKLMAIEPLEGIVTWVSVGG
jgi:hypothetical protein